MRKRPTPETDAVASIEGNWDTKALRMTAHSRKLERERDEALMDRARGETVTMTINHYERILRERDEARRECKFLWEERDEAREQYDQICSQTLIEINKVCDERDKLREALREVLKVSESTPVLTYQKMEDIASKALKDTEK